MGIGAQMIYWPDDFCDALRAAGYRVIRFDNRETGRSSRLEHLPVPPLLATLGSSLFGARVVAPYALEDMAHDAAELLDALGIESAHVVGASMGGMIAQTMAITHPHRMRSLTSIMSTTGKTGVYISEPRALKALFSPPPRTRDEAADRSIAFWNVVGSTGFDRDEDTVRARAMLAWDRGHYPTGVLRHLAAIGATGDRSARLRFVKTPTLVVHGSIDPLVRPVGGRLTAAAIDGARLEIIEGMGHDLPRGAWPRMHGSMVELFERADDGR